MFMLKLIIRFNTFKSFMSTLYIYPADEQVRYQVDGRFTGFGM